MVLVSASQNAIHEGENGVFTFTRSAASSNPLTVLYSLSGKAQLGSDYTLNATAGHVVIPGGQSSVNLVLTALLDTRKEHSEKLDLILSNGPGYNIPTAKGQKKASIVILNTRTSRNR